MLGHMIRIRIGLLGCLVMLAAAAFAEDLGIVNRKRFDYSESEFPKEFIRQYNEVYGRFLIAPEGAEYRKFRYFGTQMNNSFGDAEGWVWQDGETKKQYAILRSGRVIAVQKVGEKVEIDLTNLQRSYFGYNHVENLIFGSNIMSAAVFLAFGETKAAEFFLQNVPFTGGSGPAPVFDWGTDATLEDQFVQARFYDYMIALNSRSAEVSEWAAIQLRDSNAKILRKTLNFGELFTDPNLMIREAQRFRTQPEYRLELSQLGWMTQEDQLKSLVESLAWGSSNEVQERLASFGPEVIPFLIDCYEKEDRLSPNYPYSISSWIPTVRDRLLAAMSRIWICMPIDSVYAGRPRGQYVSADFLRKEWENQKDLWLVDRIARGLILTHGRIARNWVPRLFDSVGESERISEKQVQKGAIRLDEMNVEDRKALIALITGHIDEISRFGQLDNRIDYVELLVLLAALDEKIARIYLRKYWSWVSQRSDFWSSDSSLGRIIAQRIALGDRDQVLAEFLTIPKGKNWNLESRSRDFMPAFVFPRDSKVQKIFGEYFQQLLGKSLEGENAYRSLYSILRSSSNDLLKSPGIRTQVVNLLDSREKVGVWKSGNVSNYLSLESSSTQHYDSFPLSRRRVVAFESGQRDATVGDMVLLSLRGVLKWSPWPICSPEDLKMQMDLAKKDLQSGNLDFGDRSSLESYIWHPRR